MNSILGKFWFFFLHYPLPSLRSRFRLSHFFSPIRASMRSPARVRGSINRSKGSRFYLQCSYFQPPKLTHLTVASGIEQVSDRRCNGKYAELEASLGIFWTLNKDGLLEWAHSHLFFAISVPQVSLSTPGNERPMRILVEVRSSA